MPDLWMDVDIALSEVPVNIMPLLDDTDFKTRETAVAYNAAGMDLVWNFVTTGGAFTQTAVTPTTAGNYDWTHQGDGIYTIEIPASGGASINNDTEGFGWFSGVATGVLPWRGPMIGFRAAGLNDALIDSAYSTTRGLAGTALPNAAADAAGGLPVSDAGGLDLDVRLDVAVSSRLAPTTAGRTLDVTATGAAGIDWGNLENPTTAVNLSATNIDTDQVVASVTGAVGSVTGGVTVTTNNDKTGYALSSAGVQAIWDSLISALTTLGSIGKLIVDNLNATISSRASQTSVDTIDDLLDTEIAGIVTTLGTPAGASISADIAAIEAQTDDIGSAVAGLTGIPWNASWDAEVQSEVDDALVARNLDKLIIASGTADSGSTTTMVDAARTEADADYWKGRMILFTSGNIAGQCAIITDFNAGTDTFTFAPPLTQAVSTQTYVILPGISVWDDTLAEHLISGSTGAALNAAGSAGDPWNTALPGAYGAGTAGKIIGDNINATISSRASQTSLDTLDNFVDTEVAAILEDTGTTLPAQIAALSIPTSGAIADAVWDEATAGHTTIGTYGRFTPADVVSWDGDGSYLAALNNIMELYLAESYVNANLKAIGDVDLVTGTAQTGSSSSIRLAAGESSVANIYVGYLVLITSGTGVKQLRYINGYNGTTKDASVTPAYATSPDATSVYLLIPTGLAGADILAILSDEASATNLQNVVAEYGNEGYLPANVTGWNSSPLATPDTAGYPVVTVKDGTGQGEISITSGRVGVNLDDTAGTLAKGTDITGFNDLDAAAIQSEVQDALEANNLDHLVGTATGIPAIPAGTYLDQIMDDGTAAYDRTTDSLQAIRDRGDAAWITGVGGSNPAVLQNTTIATLASQTSFTLTAGSADNDAYNGHLIIVTDQTTAEQKAVGVVLDYVGSTKTVTLAEDPGIFTMAVGDEVDILVGKANIVAINGGLTNGNNATLSLNKIHIVASSGPGIYTQGGDGIQAVGQGAGSGIKAENSGGTGPGITFAGANNSPGLLAQGAGSGPGIRSTGGGSGGAGMELNGVSGGLDLDAGWNPAWDAEVQSEVQDALEANNLDHLVGTATGIPAIPAGTFIDQMMDDGTAAYDRTTDSLQAIRDRGDAAWTTGAGGLTEQQVRDAMKLAPSGGAAAGGSVDDLLATVETNTQNIETDTQDIQTRLPATLVSGRMDASVGAMQSGVVTAAAVATGAIDADALATDAVAEIADGVWDEARSGHGTAGTYGESFLGVVNGEAATGTLSTTAFTTNLTEATDDHYNGRIVVWLTGVLAGQATDITDYTGATKLITVTAMTEAPSNGDRFVIV